MLLYSAGGKGIIVPACTASFLWVSSSTWLWMLAVNVAALASDLRPVDNSEPSETTGATPRLA